MKLEVLRFSSSSDSTLGLLFDITKGREFLCFTLEDEYREVKVKGETRIPAGTYRITLRKEGGFNAKYAEKFKQIHKGMLWVRDVPEFEYILIHCGNDDSHTAGCLLVGDSSQENIRHKGFIGSSTQAYSRIYPKIAAALEAGEAVSITYTDYA
jgi:hypothetical protein